MAYFGVSSEVEYHDIPSAAHPPEDMQLQPLNAPPTRYRPQEVLMGPQRGYQVWYHPVGWWCISWCA